MPLVKAVTSPDRCPRCDKAVHSYNATIDYRANPTIEGPPDLIGSELAEVIVWPCGHTFRGAGLGPFGVEFLEPGEDLEGD